MRRHKDGEPSFGDGHIQKLEPVFDSGERQPSFAPRQVCGAEQTPRIESGDEQSSVRAENPDGFAQDGVRRAGRFEGVGEQDKIDAFGGERERGPIGGDFAFFFESDGGAVSLGGAAGGAGGASHVEREHAEIFGHLGAVAPFLRQNIAPEPSGEPFIGFFFGMY